VTGKEIAKRVDLARVEGMRLLTQLEEAGAITRTALILPADTTYDECEALAYMLGEMHRRSAWMIGDLLNHVERVYGETYAQAALATGLSEGTLMNYTSTCQRIPRSRRKPGLHFSTHVEVAYMEPAEQDRWLGEALERGYTRKELREAINAERDGNPDILTPAGDSCVCPTCGREH
jgi:hypothetical protein